MSTGSADLAKNTVSFVRTSIRSSKSSDRCGVPTGHAVHSGMVSNDALQASVASTMSCTPYSVVNWMGAGYLAA
jgi:hypothetical protein